MEAIKEETKEVNKEVSSDLDSLFETLIFKGRIEKEVEISTGFKIKLRPLDTSEILVAEAIDISNVYGMPVDVIQKARRVSILSHATISINDSIIKKDNLSEDENRKRRESLHQKYMALPPDTIDKMFNCYLDIVKDQNDIYNNIQKVDGGVENF